MAVLKVPSALMFSMSTMILNWVKLLTPLKAEGLQRDLDELEGWALTSHVKFNKCECQILNLGWGSPGYLYRVGNETLKSSPT